MTTRFLPLATSLILTLTSWQGSVADRRLSDVPTGTLSPDGRLVGAFDSLAHEFHVDAVGQPDSTPLARVPIAGYVGGSAISWDGRMVAFSSGVTGEGPGVRILTLPASAPARLLLKGRDVDPLEWSRDGTRLLVSAAAGPQVELRMVTVSDGVGRVLARFSTSDIGVSPFPMESLSPDASELAYDVHVAGAGRRRAVFLLPTTGGPAVQVLDASAWNSVVGWSPTGNELVIFSDRGGKPGLWALPIQSGQAAGQLRALRADFDGKPRGTTQEGGVVYERVTSPPAAQLVSLRIDANGQAASAPTAFRTHDPLLFARFPRWSAGGKSFLYVESRLFGPVVVIHSIGPDQVRELPLDLNFLFSFDWSRDGRQIVFKGTTPDGQFCLCLMDTTEGVLKVLKFQAAVDYLPRFSQDGSVVSYFRKQPSPQSVNWSYVEWDLRSNVERATSADLSRLMADPHSYPAGRSPDGRFVLATIPGDVSRLMLLDTTTTEVREIFRSSSSEAFNHYGDLMWTPDSRAVITTVATTLHDEGNEQEAWWIPVDGRKAHTITIGTTAIGENPIAIDPDGGQIALVAGRPFNAIMPFDPRPIAVGSKVELRVLDGLLARPPR